MPIGQPENTTEGASTSIDTDETTSVNTCNAQIPEAVIDGETMPVGQPENTVSNGVEMYFRTG